MRVDIRQAREGDLDAIISFIRALADYERLGDAVRLERERLRVHLFGSRPAAEVLIAEQSGVAVGFALWFTNFSTFEGRPGVYLEDLFVVPEARGAGAGTALLAGLAAIAVERDYGRLEWSVLDWNAPAIAFYQALGAQTMDGWTVNRVDGAALSALAGRSG